jgi:hypothetical protein
MVRNPVHCDRIQMLFALQANPKKLLKKEVASSRLINREQFTKIKVKAGML